MMRPFRPALTAAACAVAAAGLLVPAGTARADPGPYHRDLEELARRLQREVREFDHVVDDNFRATPEYERLLRHTQEMQRLSRHIAEDAYDHRDVRHLRRDVERLRELEGLVRAEVDRLGRHREVDRRAFRRLQERLDDVSSALRALDRELERRCEPHRP